MVNAKTAEVHLTVISADGSSSERTTQFVLENGSWKHELTQAEYDLFAGATATATASPTASSASHSPSPSATPDPSPNPSPTAITMLPTPTCQEMALLRPVAGVISTVIRLTGLFRPRPETPTISTETGTV